jgi:hypothetical protein
MPPTAESFWGRLMTDKALVPSARSWRIVAEAMPWKINMFLPRKEGRRGGVDSAVRCKEPQERGLHVVPKHFLIKFLHREGQD